jgi:ABC-type sugar transport system ATPase subunit
MGKRGAVQSHSSFGVTGLRKTFGAVEVLHAVDLELKPGEVHALVGENGAGKSTIINVLSGRLQPDGGQIMLNETPVTFRNPLAARQAGVSIIAQELELVPTLTIVENVFLGVEPTAFGFVRWGDARRRVASVLAELGVNASPDRVVRTMGVADQQLVEVAKAIIGEFQVLIMDEPTSALNLEDTERLFRIVRGLRETGVAILYVSHRLWEVFDLADRVTVLRDGARISTTEIGRTDVNTVIRGMLGDKSSLIMDTAGHPRRTMPTHARMDRPVLEVKALGSGELLRDISLAVHEGEIIGLAGVIGSGRTELCEAIYGLRRVEEGEVRLNGKPAKLDEPKKATRSAVFMLPEDRKGAGIFARLDVRENAVLNSRTDVGAIGDNAAQMDAAARPQSHSLSERLGMTRVLSGAERGAFGRLQKAFSIRCGGPEEMITALSGGNQQKVLFARAALAQPQLLLLAEPTRGVDVGAKEEIYAAIEKFATRGVAILVSSSEIAELLRLTSRIYVLRNGRIAAELVSRETSEEEVLARMAG